MNLFPFSQEENIEPMINQGIGNEEYYKHYYLSRDWRSYRTLFSKIMAFSEPGPILDIGAGVGHVVEGALKWGFDCIGIEGSISAVEIAHQRCPNIPLVHHLLSETLPFADESFQTIIMNQVIEHLEPQVVNNTLSESYRILKKGGFLLITSPSKFNIAEKKEDSTHINMYSPSELARTLKENKFEKIQSFNSPLNFLGTNYIGQKIAVFIFKITRWDFLSATSNCIAYKAL
jgi:SAM-dependent methyltransferase